MVPIGYIVRCAMRYDTVMSWAMRRALRIVGRPRPAPRAEARPEVDDDYIDPNLLYCIRNEHPVMDGVHV